MAATKHLFIRCNGGHYYRGHVHCPFDGWSIDGIDRLLAAFDALDQQTVEALRREGIADTLLDRVLIIEFGNSASAFQALAPNVYLHGDKILNWHEVGLELY